MSIARRLPLQDLAVHLTEWMQPLSPTRAAIVAEQLRGLVQEEHRHEYVLFGAGEEQIAALVLLHQQGDRFVSVVHAGFLDGADAGVASDVLLESLRVCLSGYCSDKSLPFIQWSTEPNSDPEANHQGLQTGSQLEVRPGELTPERLGFTWLGDLDFLALDFQSKDDPVPPRRAAEPGLFLESVDPNDLEARRELEAVIASTYEDSLDCPRLEEFRTPAEIIETYRYSVAYRPDWWFLVQRDSVQGIRTNVGALILAEHRTRGADKRDSIAIELVYMGVVPEHRGMGVGRQIVQRVLGTCQSASASRLILAVDRCNHYAGEMYRSYGMKRLVSESIWGQRFQSLDE